MKIVKSQTNKYLDIKFKRDDFFSKNISGNT